MIIKRCMLWMVMGALLLGLFARPCMGQAEPTAAQADQKAKAVEAAGKITPVLDAILTQVNELKVPAPGELSAGQNLIDTSKRYLLHMDDKQKAQYCLLQSWLAYYSGQLETAHTNAAKAWKLDATSGDALASQIAMAILADKKPMLPKPQKPAKAPRTRQAGGMMEGAGMMGNAGDAALQIVPGKLNFDVTQFLVDAIDKKVEPLELNCLNGTTFNYKPGDTALCVLFWQKFETKKAVAVSNEPNQGGAAVVPPLPPMPPMMGMGGFNAPGMGGEQAAERTPTAAFGKLFGTGISGGRVKFLAVNVDLATHKKAIVEEMLKQPQAWAQVIVADQTTKSIPEISSGWPDRPVLMMADSTGTIRYAGPVMGFIAPMLLNQYLGANVTVSPKIQTVADSNSLSAAEPNSAPKPAPVVQAPAPKPEPKPVRPRPQPKELSEEDKIQAEQKLSVTRDLFMNLGKKPGLTYKNGVRFCREIMKDYPGSEYAEEARKMLREMPEKDRNLYKITNEELGQ